MPPVPVSRVGMVKGSSSLTSTIPARRSPPSRLPRSTKPRCRFRPQPVCRWQLWQLRPMAMQRIRILLPMKREYWIPPGQLRWRRSTPRTSRRSLPMPPRPSPWRRSEVVMPPAPRPRRPRQRRSRDPFLPQAIAPLALLLLLRLRLSLSALAIPRGGTARPGFLTAHLGRSLKRKRMPRDAAVRSPGVLSSTATASRVVPCARTIVTVNHAATRRPTASVRTSSMTSWLTSQRPSCSAQPLRQKLLVVVARRAAA
mmetsp:Transcript_997/g.2776  ORF Transcript_997/g.2776 Transcript_997/m.2776 type:complete len:256 (-) Transcript_997:3071-3838(-)